MESLFVCILLESVWCLVGDGWIFVRFYVGSVVGCVDVVVFVGLWCFVFGMICYGVVGIMFCKLIFYIYEFEFDVLVVVFERLDYLL